MEKIFQVVLGLAFMLHFGCATMTRGGTEMQEFITTPAGARVELDTGQSCRTPCSLEVDRKLPIKVVITKNGFVSQKTTINSTLDGGTAARNTTSNAIIFLPGVPDYIDYKTGANFSHKPNPLTADLEPEQTASSYDLNELPARFKADHSGWWGVDSEKTKYAQEMHEKLVFVEGYSPIDPATDDKYWTRLSDLMQTYDRQIENDRPVNQFIKKLRFERQRSNPKDLALIITNWDYSRSDINDVTPAQFDGDAIHKYARDYLGIPDQRIFRLKNATYANFISWLGDANSNEGRLKNWADSEEGELFVYYSGHGAPSVSSGKSLLVPVDVDQPSLERTGYPLSVLYKNLSQLPSKKITVVIDSCFSGDSQAGPVIRRASPLVIVPNPLRIPEKLNVVTSTSQGQISSWDDEMDLGLFTKHYLLAHSGKADERPYGNRNGDINWSELVYYVSSNVKEQALTLYNRDQSPVFTRTDD